MSWSRILNIKVCSSVGRFSFLGCLDQIQGIIWDEAPTFAPSRSEDQMLIKTLMSHFSAAIPACCPMLDAQEVILSHSTSASICVVRCWLDVPITMVKKLFTCYLLSVRKTGTLDRLQICTTMCRSSLLYFQCFWNRKRMVVAANLFPEQIALVKAEVAIHESRIVETFHPDPGSPIQDTGTATLRQLSLCLCERQDSPICSLPFLAMSLILIYDSEEHHGNQTIDPGNLS